MGSCASVCVCGTQVGTDHRTVARDHLWPQFLFCCLDQHYCHRTGISMLVTSPGGVAHGVPGSGQ